MTFNNFVYNLCSVPAEVDFYRKIFTMEEANGYKGTKKDSRRSKNRHC